MTASTPASARAASFGRGWRSRLLAAVYPPARQTYAQMNAYAQAWEASNDQALRGGGPVWVVLGDSTAQGVGASRFDAGWVGVVRDRLHAADSRTPLPSPLRVVNLSRSGARLRDALDSQWPRVAELGLQPVLVVAVIGANDLTHTPVEKMSEQVRELVALLPPGSVVGTLPRGWHEGKARVVNAVIRAEAEGRRLRVADLWQVTGPPWRGYFARDGFHPNDRGHQRWAQAVLSATEQRLDQTESPPGREQA